MVASSHTPGSLPPLGHQRRRDSGLVGFAFGELRLKGQAPVLGREVRGCNLPDFMVSGMLTKTASPLRDTAPGSCKHFVGVKMDA